MEVVIRVVGTAVALVAGHEDAVAVIGLGRGPGLVVVLLLAQGINNFTAGWLDELDEMG